MNEIPIDLVGCNVRITDRYHKDYKLTKADIQTAFFYGFMFIALIIGLSAG